MSDIKRRHGRAFVEQMTPITISELPAYIQSGRKELSDRDLALIGTVMDTHLGLGGFYFQASPSVFLVSFPEVGAVPLRQAIVEELNLKLTPLAQLDTERTLRELTAQFGDDVSKYLHRLDIAKLLFADTPGLGTVPTAVRTLALQILDQQLEGIGHFCKLDTNAYGVLFASPSPDFARTHMADLKTAIAKRCASLVATYTHHMADPHHPEHHATAAERAHAKSKPKVLTGPLAEVPSHALMAKHATASVTSAGVTVLSNSINTASQEHARYKDRLAHLPWDMDIGFDPILRRRTGNFVGRFCRPVMPENHTAPALAKSVTAMSSDAWNAQQDLPLAHNLVKRLLATAGQDKPEITCLPVHFHTMSSPVHREVLFSHLAQLNKDQHHYVSLELVGFQRTVAPLVINEYIRMLRPYCRTVLLQADLDGKLLDHFAGLPVHAAGLDLNFPGITASMAVKKIRRFAERSHYFFRRIYVRGIAGHAPFKAAIEQDYNYISGDMLDKLMQQDASRA